LPKNDEGEFEPVLGNRQLISVFVIVVALLGVFFSMGYIVGRNSSPANGAAEAARADKSASDAHTPDSALASDPRQRPARARMIRLPVRRRRRVHNRKDPPPLLPQCELRKLCRRKPPGK
jgi:hypothetical protein